MNKMIILFALPLCLSAGMAYGEQDSFNSQKSGRLLFNPATVVSVDGQITKIDTVDHLDRRGAGLHLQLSGEGKNYEVLLGPEWYMKKIGLNLQANQKINVQGSMIQLEGKQHLIPTQITISGKTYILRNSDGIPAWAGQGQGRF